MMQDRLEASCPSNDDDFAVRVGEDVARGPEEGALRVLFIADDGTAEDFPQLPVPLREPVAARFKDGAGLDVQECHMPVCDARDGRLYEMLVSCRTGTQSETIVLRLVPQTSAAAS